ncbi:MAG: 2-dehydro-3-deoxy-6-phosphogalactonate aldolase [Pseudomonadota bacterium]
MNELLDEYLAEMPVIAILRGVAPDEVIEIAEGIIAAGIKVIEVPLNSPDAVQSIKLLSDRLASKGIFGCGTCVTTAQADAVADAGGSIMVTPNVNTDVIKKAIQRNMIPMPGWATPTEAFAAYHAGARYLKLFPASTYGLAHVNAVKSVLPNDAKILAVGGVGAANAKGWFDGGISGIGIGSELYKAGRSASDVAARAADIVSAVKQR